jgi:hypothetical protein
VKVGSAGAKVGSAGAKVGSAGAKVGSAGAKVGAAGAKVGAAEAKVGLRARSWRCDKLRLLIFFKTLSQPKTSPHSRSPKKEGSRNQMEKGKHTGRFTFSLGVKSSLLERI